MSFPTTGLFRVVVVDPSTAGIFSNVTFRVLPVDEEGNPVASGGSNAMGVVVHGSDANVARPTGYGVVTWIGTVEPTHMEINDIWEEVP